MNPNSNGADTSHAQDATDTDEGTDEVTSTTPGNETQADDDTADASGDAGDTDGDADGAKDDNEPVPFANGGKEKFTVNGKEFEWDWATTKKYAQLGRAGQAALQKAAVTEKKGRDFFGRIVDGAKSDPENLIRTLLGNPNWTFKGAKPTGKKTGGQANDDSRTDEANGEDDPRDAKIQELETRLSKFENSHEERLLNEERQAFQTEMDAAVKSYPLLDSKANRAYLKSEYRAALASGREVSVDDVAFTIAEELKEERTNQEAKRKERLNQNRDRSVVTGRTGGDTGSAKPFSREDIHRLAGKTV